MWFYFQTSQILAGICGLDELALVLVGSRVNNQLKIKQKR